MYLYLAKLNLAWHIFILPGKAELTHMYPQESGKINSSPEFKELYFIPVTSGRLSCRQGFLMF